MKLQPNQTEQTEPKRTKARLSKWTLAILASLTALGAFFVCADGHPVGGWRGHGAPPVEHIVEKMTQRLDLSAEQQAAIEAILARSRTEVEPLRAQLADFRGDVRALMISDTFDEAQVRGELEAKAQVMVELMVHGARTMHQVREQLTPEQRVEADAMLERFGHQRGRRGGAQRPSADGDPSAPR